MEANPYAPPQVTELSAPLSGTAEAEAIRQEHLKVEATIKSVGILYYLGSFFTLFAMLPLLQTPVSEGEGLTNVVVSAVFLLLGLAQGVLAYGLRRLRSWSRWPTVALAFIGLLGFPLGTLISIIILVNLMGAKATKVFSPGYLDIIAATPHVKYKTSIVVKVLLVLLLLVLVGVVVSVMLA